MRSKRNLQKVLVLAVLVVALFAVAACQKEEEQVEEADSTSEAAIETAVQPTPAPPQATAEPPTEEPTEAAVPAVEPTPSEVTTAGEIDMEEYVSVTEFFSVKVPAGWSSEETFPGGAFVMANSAAALERFNNDSAVESGDLVVNVGFLPYALFRQREVVPLDIQFEATPDLFLQSLLPMFRLADSAVLSDAELVSLSDESDAGLLTVSDEGREGLILMTSAGDEVVAFVSAVGFPGEMGGFQEVIYAVAAEVAFSGAQEALYGTFLGG